MVPRGNILKRAPAMFLAVAGPVASVPTHVTPLRFHAADAAGGRSRRLGTATGFGLHGNVHTLGYFSADVCLGNFSGAQQK